MKKLLLFLLILFFSLSSFVFIARAKECNEGDSTLQQICLDLNELNKALEMSKAATQPLESELGKLENQIKRIQAAIDIANKKIESLENDIFEREVKLEYQKEVLAARVRSYYKKSRQYSPFLILLVSSSANDLFRELSYRQTTTREDRRIIIDVSQDLITLKEDKEKLEKNKTTLAASQKNLDQQAGFFRTEVSKAKTYQAQISSQIAELTAKQQAILSARSGTFITGVGEVPIGSDFDASIAGFYQNAPSGSFAVFSFGAYTHRKGMSQYGALGRANDGQNYKEILRAYYDKEPVGKDTGGNISVVGHGEIDFEGRYLYGIAEMPSSWPMEALKAQAIAARTYAYRYKQEGKAICITEACQVFSSSKAGNPPSAWKEAVDQTRGEVLEDVVTFYSSTAGGYLTTSGWDTTDKSGGGEWTSRAWESKGGSPWFYKAWYRQGYRNDSNPCGRKPWMSEEELADIINAWLVLKKGEGGSIDTSRILPVTINSCPIGGQSGNPYSLSELRGFISNPVKSISGKPVVSNDNNANTSNIRFQTNRGEINISGSEFKEVFNTRAPGYLSIPQRGFAFFNIEKK